MSQTDPSTRSESGEETAGTAVARGREYVSRAAPHLRRGVESGAVTAIVGGMGLLSGLRALLDGDRDRGIARLAFGAAFLLAAVAQRRSRGRSGDSDVETTDVVDTGSDVEAIADEAGGVGEVDHAGGDAAASVVDTSPDLEDAGTGLESESDADVASGSVDQRDVVDTGVDRDDAAEATARDAAEADDVAEPTTETEDVDRLGAAALDSQSREVPVPQRAFNQGFLAHSSEAFWGVRTNDDAVLVSRNYDAVQDREGVEFVASSEIGDDARELPIPNAVLTHWDEVYGGGTAVVGGDDVLFVTTDDLAAGDLLRVLPAAWADDVFDEG